ncbi:hypothetical protein [Tessaracoccus massiliensis]|uniref:hypothetical protein n=1 Tax=Tessaracoccus massiliensis TaxID=1522311 RepID=UPI00058EF387|nr:hypothetical protein [Tessaracoccus massiliensis]
MDEAQRISEFWQWWRQHAPRLAQLLDDGEDQAAMQAYAPLLAEQVQQIDERLGYRIDSADGRSRSTLTISAHGQQWLMPLARRVRDAAPPPDEHWNYSNFVLRAPDLAAAQFDVDGAVLNLADARVGLRDLARKVDVGLWHPGFEGFETEAQRSLAAAMLDAALGEEVTECWVGEVEVIDEPPVEAAGLEWLQSYVDDVRARFVELPDVTPWATVEGTRYDGMDVHARVRVPVSIAREPLLEKVVTIRLPLEDPSLSPYAEALEERIQAAIGADGELTAIETLGDVRTWYCYVNPASDAAQRLLDLARDEGMPAEAANDPTWEVVSHLS